MSGSRDYFKAIHGKKFDDWKKTARIPKADESIDRLFLKRHTKYPLRSIGIGESGAVFVTEEEREVNFHILGAPGEGKSRFLEDNIRQDIDMGNGLCLLDPSDFGDTCKKVLKYCASIGHEKVVVIDPGLDKIPCIKPLANNKQSLDGVMEAVGILFNARETDTPRIKRYLSAVLRLLAKRNLTLYESQQFAIYQDPERLNLEYDRDSQTLRTVFRSQYHWEQHFSSTINRLDMFWESPLSLMLGADTGIDFIKMVREGWVILVNLFPSKLTFTEARLLGVLVTSQIIQAVDTLRNHHWKGVYYLYMDEAARFATPQIEQVLTYKRKSGLRLMLAHHYFDQFEDKKVMNAIKQGARIKVMFNTPSYDDRLQMVKDLGYGGDIPPILASYANQDLPKQYAIIKKNKEAPVRVRIPDVPEVKLSNSAIEDYLKIILRSPWYLTRDEIRQQINARGISTYPKGSKSGKAPNRKADSKAPLSKRGGKQAIPQSRKEPPVPKGQGPIKI